MDRNLYGILYSLKFGGVMRCGRVPLLRNSGVCVNSEPRTHVRGCRMALLRNSIAVQWQSDDVAIQSQRDNLGFNRNAMTGDSLGCQSEVTEAKNPKSRNATTGGVCDVTDHCEIKHRVETCRCSATPACV